MNCYIKLLFFLYLNIIAASGLQSAATRMAYIDAFATARGNAFTATADNPSAVFYNGAGLTQLKGTQIHSNLFTISLDYSADTNHKKDVADDEWKNIPGLFISHDINDSPFTFGFGIYSPYASCIKWGKDASFSTEDYRIGYEIDLAYTKHHAVLAWKVTEELSLSAGMSYDDTNIQLKSNALEYDANDDTLGFSLAALWQPTIKHSFGLNYQAKTEINYAGKATITGVGTYESKVDLIYPESITLGYSYRPNEQWNIELNVDWTNWEPINRFEYTGLPYNPGSPPPIYDLHWNSAYILALGATHYFGDGWNVSAGYTYIENAVPEQTMLTITPDTDRHAFSIGVGRDYKRMYWQITCHYIYASDRKINNNDFESLKGDYEMDSYSAAFSIGYRF